MPSSWTDPSTSPKFQDGIKRYKNMVLDKMEVTLSCLYSIHQFMSSALAMLKL